MTDATRSSQPPPPPNPNAPQQPAAETTYFVMIGEERQGPFSTAEMIEKIIRGQLTRETLAWTPVFGQNWRELYKCRDLKVHLPPPPADSGSQRGGNHEQRRGRNDRRDRSNDKDDRSTLNTNHEHALPSFGSFIAWFSELMRYSYYENLIPTPTSLKLLLLAARASQERQNELLAAENVKLAEANAKLPEGDPGRVELKPLIELVEVPEFIPNLRLSFAFPESTEVKDEAGIKAFGSKYGAIASTEIGDDFYAVTAESKQKLRKFETDYRILAVKGRRLRLNVPVELVFDAVASPGELRFAGPIFCMAIPVAAEQSASGMTRFKPGAVVVGCCGKLREHKKQDAELYTPEMIAVIKTERLLHEGVEVTWSVADFFFHTFFMQGVLADVEAFLRATSDIYQRKTIATGDHAVEVKKGLTHNPFTTALTTPQPAAATPKADVDPAADVTGAKKKRAPRTRPGNKGKKGDDTSAG